MIMDWPKLIDWLKLKPKYLFGVAVTCLVVVGLPKEWRQYLGYDKIIDPYRGWISLIGIAFGVYGLIVLVSCIPAWVLEKWQEWLLKRNAPNILRKLAPDEKAYLAKYIKKDVSSLEFGINDGVICGLRAKNVVYLPSSAGYFSRIAFNLQPWVLEAFDRHPELKDEIRNHLVEEPKIL